MIAEEPAGVGAEGDPAGAGQGCDVDDDIGIEAFGIGQGVAEDEAPLGVGVEDLHGLSG
uniref:Uncharacterized protein n=1 Tax=Candidatus Kentrum sp. LFY TaxID=2126342 RepID=A0A450WG27_9GAMM|nr:MAG: hypothetical protein BECKLFY1418C_GA0070996_101923 [Candidatus Kentron sp. LFY]